ncbi:hypothetical protein PCANC_02435 [Puccinia coronata f. sp. avenae]|uniref:Uncharacterized protein n=1 Tax=Puccinia coronata f. sp. avenae TaxID=200324 RepID=A0A2N5W501_9BASI|nr:hypothetical protein PCANC_02435 [Puccinia coronata f. sp. avenae]
MGTRPSIGRFTLKAPVGRSMEASSGRFEIKAHVGRLMAASSGRYLTGAPVGRHHKASSGRSCQVAPIGRCHQASNGRFNLKAPTGRFHGASNGRFQAEAANGHAADAHSGRMQVVGLTLAEIILPRLSSPSSFHLVRTGLKPSIGRFRDASGTPPGRYAWTVRTSVLVEVNRGTVPTPPKFGRPMAVQRCAHWSSAGTRGVHVHAKYVAKWAAQLWAVSRRPHTQRDGSDIIIAVWARSCDPAKQNRCPKGHMVNGPLAASPNHCERITIRSARSGSHQGVRPTKEQPPGLNPRHAAGSESQNSCYSMIFNAPVCCPSNGGGRRVAANRPHRPCSVAPTIMVTVLPACLGRQGRHVVTSRPHAVSMTEPSQVRRLSSEIVPLCSSMDHWAARRLTATQVQVSPPVRLKVYDQNTNLLNYCASPNVNQCMLFSLGSHRERYEETPVRSRSKVFMSVACTALHRLQLYNKDHGQWPDESSPSSSSTCSNNNPKLNMH